MRFGSDDDADSSQVEDRRGSQLRRTAGLRRRRARHRGRHRLCAHPPPRRRTCRSTTARRGQAAPSASPSVPDNQQLGGSCRGRDVGERSGQVHLVRGVERAALLGARAAAAGRAATSPRTWCCSASDAVGLRHRAARDRPVLLPARRQGLPRPRLLPRAARRASTRTAATSPRPTWSRTSTATTSRICSASSADAQAEQRDPRPAQRASVRLELQADCFAGVWGHAAYEKGTVSRERVAQALDAGGRGRRRSHPEGDRRARASRRPSRTARRRSASTGSRRG